MKVLQLNYFDISGGASRAAYRIHHALRAAGVDSTMLAALTSSGDWTVEGPQGTVAKALARIRPQLAAALLRTMRTDNPIIHSLALLPSRLTQSLNHRDADILHLHWVQGEMLSIAEIGRIEKPVVWTLHDMWAFCGAEHLSWDNRWREGYRHDNRPAHEKWIDLNLWTWQRKRKHWQRPMHIVTPSRWLADCVRESALMRDWPISVVPNCIDTVRWQPLDKSLARELLGLPVDVPLLLFGAIGGGAAFHKGFDLLLDALMHLRDEVEDLHLVVFGQLPPRYPPDLGFPIHYTGHLHDDLSLRALYSSSDALVVPSRQDNLPNTAVESHACGTPVVAFEIGGLPDIISHKHTGYLAKPFDTVDLAAGIKWILTQPSEIQKQLRSNARSRSEGIFSNSVVAEQYRAVYEEVIYKS